jgi:hypothetical protein
LIESYGLIHPEQVIDERAAAEERRARVPQIYSFFKRDYISAFKEANRTISAGVTSYKGSTNSSFIQKKF